MSRSLPIPLWQRALILLSGTVVGLVIVIALWWGRPVLIPVALAAFLTFLLNPIISRLQRLGVSRVPAVMIAVTMAGIAVMSLTWIMTRQVTAMLAELPQNRANLVAKVKTLRQLGSTPFFDRFGQMVEEIDQELHPPAANSASPHVGTAPSDEDQATSLPSSVVVRSEPMPWSNVTDYLSSAVEVFVTLAFALVLLVFFLLGRQDLRDRIVVLAGKAHLALTSKAIEDITDRISRYIVMVALVNGGFGLVLTGGLLAMRVPYAVLWGFLAAGLRFIPYIGPWLGAIFPIAMSLAISDGWWQPVGVFAFVLILELISNNIVEPLAFGHSTGVSATALLISAAFWLYLWGPVGLVLSAPIAVCLVVLGKNVPQLSFLNLLLGDQPALRAEASLYQRYLLDDQVEAARLVAQRRKSSSLADVFDEMLVPVLNFAKRDVKREHLSDEVQQTVRAGIRESLEQFQEEIPSGQAHNENEESETSSESLHPIKILGCPAMDDSDHVGLEMLQQLLNPKDWDLELMSVETLTSEVVKHSTDDRPAVVCIAALPPGGLAQARYLCKRLREASPELQIIVGRWGQKRIIPQEQERLQRAGANVVTATLTETIRYLDSRLPLLARETSSPLATVQ